MLNIFFFLSEKKLTCPKGVAQGLVVLDTFITPGNGLNWIINAYFLVVQGAVRVPPPPPLCGAFLCLLFQVMK